MRPLVSVLLSVRNGERHLESALRSLERQTWPDIEIIAVDDGSTDRTGEILQALHSRHPKTRLVRTEGIGLSRALALATTEATGTLLARQDDDDLSHPERFRRQVDVLLANPDVGVLGTAAQIIDPNGDPAGDFSVPRGAAIRRALGVRSPFVHGSVMMRREVYDSSGGYRAGFRAAEDFDLWTRMPPDVRFENLSEPLYSWRNNPEGVTARSRTRQLFEIAAVREFAWQRAVHGHDSAKLLLETDDLEAFIAAYPQPRRFLTRLGEVYAREGRGADARDLLGRAMKAGGGVDALRWWLLSFAGELRGRAGAGA